ncbi:hypothetical protein B0H10DRAFT_1869485 [Mycena sp. CBHHK59/15]|nr:hypothetical protein B0H10DRAFT_1869485 [Mycena sp. CBHHK59/15]
MEFQREEVDKLAQATALVISVYQQVYEEFTLWKADHTNKVFTSLGRPRSDATASFPPESVAHTSRHGITPHPSASASEYMEVWDYKTSTTERIPVELVRVASLPSAAPAHEYSTQIERSIFHGDDPSALPFIPFADDPSFDLAAYLEEYKSFGWEEPARDPDLEFMVIETTRRLCSDHKMAYRHIDETGILPLELLDRGDQRGMIYRSQRRDFPDWPEGVPASAKRLQNGPDPTSDMPDKQLANLVSTFCTNLNCLVGFCSTHIEPVPMPLSNTPLLTARMKEFVTGPCGEDCFLVKTVGDHAIDWPDEDTQLLRTILDASPDTPPCDLATICRRPCYETFHQRCFFLPDGQIDKKGKKKAKTTKPSLAKTGSLKFDDFDPRRFTPGLPCSHEGLCDSEAQCACFFNQAHCESGCRCSRKCARRWRGCSCSSSKRFGVGVCRTDRCSCYLAHRECDPELCLKCQAKDSKANLCRNTPLQMGRHKGTVVGPARWGRGLFMTEEANEDELIIEYVGELIYEPTTDSRELVAAHRGRNYLFQLNDTVSVDGTYVGNNSRYINHDAANPNCKAHVRMVNGEHRIGIYATRHLALGDEVLFDYGGEFFRVDSDKTAGTPISARKQPSY